MTASLADRLSRWLSKSGNTGADSQSATGNAPESVMLAAAVLLFEVEHADFEHEHVERAALEQALVRLFSPDAETLQRLVAKVGEEAEQRVSLHDVIATVNEHLDREGRVALLRHFWEVAYADGELHPNEEHAIRRLADLMHLPHSDFIRTRLSVTDSVS